MGKVLFNIYFWLSFLILTVCGVALLPLILLVNGLILQRSTASGLRRAIRFYGWTIVCWIPFLAPVQVIYGNRGSLPSPAIFVANHNSAIDPYLFGALPVENSFVTSWPFKIPLYGFFMRLAEYANATDGWEKVHDACRHLLDNGSSVTIWPEGTRSRTGEMGRFKNGAFALAVESGYPIVPVCILGSGDVLPPGSRLLRPGRVRLVILSPVYPRSSIKDPQEQIRDMRIRSQEAIRDALKQHGHLSELQPSWEGS